MTHFGFFVFILMFLTCTVEVQSSTQFNYIRKNVEQLLVEAHAEVEVLHLLLERESYENDKLFRFLNLCEHHDPFSTNASGEATGGNPTPPTADFASPSDELLDVVAYLREVLTTTQHDLDEEFFMKFVAFSKKDLI